MTSIAQAFLAALLLLPHHARAKAADPVEVTWRKAGLESALKEARAADKPLLVYWGAVWCPPCNALKAKAFHDPGFVKATRSFIPVYLDGDSEDAQAWGERLHASGYPTLLVLNSSGREVQRLVTSDPLPDLLAEIERTREDLSGWDGLLKKAALAKRPADLLPAEWRRLAARDWTGDERWIDREIELADQLRAVGNAFPPEMVNERVRLELAELRERVLVSSKDKKPLAESERKRGLALVRGLLSDPELVAVHAMPLAFLSGDLVRAAFPGETPSAERTDFIKHYLTAFRAYRKRPGLSLENRLYSTEPFTELTAGLKAAGVPLALEEANDLANEAITELANAKTEQQVIVVLNSLADLLGSIGRPAEGQKHILENLARVSSKNELMSTLAELEEKQGHPAEALRWTEKAYRETVGKNSRLQWGVRYVRYLIEHEPKGHGRIEATSHELLTDSVKRTDSFSGRNLRSLNRLAKALKGWSSAEKVKLADEKAIGLAGFSCTRSGLNPESRARCEALLREMAVAI